MTFFNAAKASQFEFPLKAFALLFLALGSLDIGEDMLENYHCLIFLETYVHTQLLGLMAFTLSLVCSWYLFKEFQLCCNCLIDLF